MSRSTIRAFFPPGLLPRLGLACFLLFLVSVPPAPAQEADPPIPAGWVISILRQNPDLMAGAKARAMRVLQQRGLTVTEMTDEGLFSEIRSDEQVRGEISQELKARGLAPPASRQAERPAPGLVPPPAAPESRPAPQAPAAAGVPLPPPPPPASPLESGPKLYPASDSPGGFVRNFIRDQRDIWTSPSRARVNDLNWLLPLAGVTSGLISADAELSSRIDTTGFFKHSGTVSNAGVGVLFAVPAGLYIAGKMHADDHEKETGILAIEAAANGMAVSEGFKLAFQRQRPTDGTGQGEFWGKTNGLSFSFPSQHAVLAWSLASVVAHEYPGTMTKILVYGLAAGVSTARVTGRNHFPSDVVVGSAMGWLIGRQVYMRHHNPELGGGDYGTFSRSEATENHPAENMASPYVPLDSWIYPAFERLSALGVIPSQMLGMRPWTRRECARLLEEASGLADVPNVDEASRLYQVLEKEFDQELHRSEQKYIQLDSVYFRGTGISGPPLTDSYHFGQTLVNDWGRPYQQGFNAVAGFSSSSAFGPMGFYIRGEFEHAPSAPGYSQAVQDAIQIADSKPPGLATPIATFDQFRLLDAYVMWNFKGWQASFGKQSLWTSETRDPFLWSDNAEPIYMFRFDQTIPRKLPSFLKYLGPYRSEFWFGRMGGHHTIGATPVGTVVSEPQPLDRQPFVDGVKVTFKPTPNFEFSVGKTGLFGGPFFPITLGTFGRSMFSAEQPHTTGLTGDPGDRRSTFDFTWRVPGLRKWLMIYDDSFVEDEISPVAYPRRAAHNAGLYMPQIPFLHKLDFRFEGGYTNLPNLIQPPAGGFFYWNIRYLDGYTNNGFIVGNGTVGRQGISFRAESNYWVAADRTITVGYRNQEADTMFLQGGSLKDVYIHSEWAFNPQVSLTSLLQYEWWNYPLLSGGTQKNNFTAQFQITYRPHWKLSSKDQE